MRILITGFVAFVIWCFISAWLYNDKLLPVINKPEPVQPVPEIQTTVADSLMKIKESIPGVLLIYFEFNDVKFKPDPLNDKKVAEFSAWLEKYPESMLSVTGHTDLVGAPEYNMALGLRRAKSVEKYLVSKGINSTRMITGSEGENKPAADYLTLEGRAMNRRTEVSIKM